MKWLLLLPQLPASSSTARVALWRQLRAAGATNAVQGAWVLPATPERASTFEQLAHFTTGVGGTAAVFECETVSGIADDELIGSFRADRAREYEELATKVDDFFAEVEKETTLGKFDFAELEEIEDDLARLRTWLAKIRERDFFPDERLGEAVALVEKCEAACREFAEQVYIAEQPGSSGTPGEPQH